MRKIRNPFTGESDYGCFGCSQNHPAGLKMEFWEDGEEVLSFWEIQQEFQGFPSVLHGGIQATLIDEVACWAIFIKAKSAGVTKAMEISYDFPVRTNQKTLTLKASLGEPKEGHITPVHVSLYNENQTVPAARATVDYFVFPERIARKRNIYPGYQAFWED